MDLFENRRGEKRVVRATYGDRIQEGPAHVGWAPYTGSFCKDLVPKEEGLTSVGLTACRKERSKIRKHNVPVFPYNDILWFQVTTNNLEHEKVFKSKKNLYLLHGNLQLA